MCIHYYHYLIYVVLNSTYELFFFMHSPRTRAPPPPPRTPGDPTRDVILLNRENLERYYLPTAAAAATYRFDPIIITSFYFCSLVVPVLPGRVPNESQVVFFFIYSGGSDDDISHRANMTNPWQGRN